MNKKKEPETEIEDSETGDVEIEYLTHKKPVSKKRSSSARSPAHADKELKSRIEEQDTEIKTLTEEVEKLRLEYLRSAADKENLRKRLEREKSEYFQYALSDLLREFLGVLDNFERALETGPDMDNASFREGVELIYRQYLDSLKKQGVTPIDTPLEHFDPTNQQAFITEESDEVSEPTVIEVLQRGYRLHDRLLRPALVKVAVPKKGDN